MSVHADSARNRFRHDRARYPRGAWVREPAIWAVAVYRLGQALRESSSPGARLLWPLYGLLALGVRLATHIEIPAGATIGPGLRIHHLGPIVVHVGAVLGADCELNTGVVIGNRGPADEAPQLGDGVSLGVHCCVLGAVKVGDGARVGAMTLVLQDVPPGATAVGIPARILTADAHRGALER